ncbi:fumarylacetoacetate hydrolase family protein [Frankia sp. CNm7]|uniref:Fumarylacetoacetate hydrolase family protein n=1 Tax=Frankia nepalensis TaxID=1836974 RepID=A0A937RXQ6_9ACTN|nr:fumarylacetoacetate hydrolase family protein [Frankia nepalensis]MBL7502144.1 fumarylacetoacetate hydrolase family protein [Frankia nepalensis]MBL7514366.1 fumarylacetoacetate hydrolase family protein [Frankia nepalensis]MBL7521304.1 fumarylacetoacetate hydrolase family protein [Frankia nepalensis]MBL7633716.1 fumarylacetoacetate hydrolase family protein [Frankia nepalensis]
MRFVGFRDGGRSVVVGVLVPGEDGPAVLGLAPVEEFYADLRRWREHAGEAVSRPGAAARPAGELTLAPPVPPAARVLCVGLNYRAHAAETGLPLPKYPALFGRWTVSLTVDGTPAPVPAGERGLDWEGELGVVVGATLADVDEAAAMAGVFGYAAFNDLSARRAQGRSPQWTLGKNSDFSGPLGPIVTADEAGDPADGWRVVTRVRTRAADGSRLDEIVQDGDTSDMIFTVGEVLSFISRTITLHPGDLLVTGTPAGVGYIRKPPRYLVPGDWVEVEIERVGRVSTPIVDTSGRG